MKHYLRLAVFLLAVFLICGQKRDDRPGRDASASCCAKNPKEKAAMPKHIIRTIRLAHCARGPERCAKCREMDEPKICLLDIDPPNRGREARRTIEVDLDGKREWREFDVVRSFADEAEARRHAEENGIKDVKISGHLDSAR